MQYAQFYQTLLDGSLDMIPGNDGITILDGRWSTSHCIGFVRALIRRQLQAVARDPRKYFNVSHFEGFRIFKGNSFTDSRPITEYISLK